VNTASRSGREASIGAGKISDQPLASRADDSFLSKNIRFVAKHIFGKICCSHFIHGVENLL
jgi:hypothetical protein